MDVNVSSPVFVPLAVPSPVAFAFILFDRLTVSVLIALIARAYPSPSKTLSAFEPVLMNFGDVISPVTTTLLNLCGT